MERRLAIIKFLLWFIIVAFLTGILINSIANKNWRPEMFSFFKYETVGEYEFDQKEIHSIKANFKSDEIEIKKSESNSVKVIEKIRGKGKKLDYSLSGGVLNLASKSLESINFSGLKVELYLPPKIYDEIDIKIASGEAYIDNVSVNKMTINISSGRLNFSNFEADEINAECLSGNIKGEGVKVKDNRLVTASGSIDVSGELNTINAECKSGNIDIETHIQPEELNVSTGSGNIEIKIPDNEGFEISHNVASGNFKSNFDMHEVNNKSVYKNGGYLYNISIKSGNIRLLKNKIN